MVAILISLSEGVLEPSIPYIAHINRLIFRKADKKTHAERPSTPRTSTPRFIIPVLDVERSLIPQWHIYQAMMYQCTHSRQRRALLAASLRRSSDEQTCVFTVVGAGGPLPYCGVPKRFPLRWEVAEAGGDAEKECIVWLHLGAGDDGVGGFGTGMELGENVVR